MNPGQRIVCATLLLCGLSIARSASLPNENFESGLDGWRFWTREPRVGVVTVDSGGGRDGAAAARIEHRGEKDWSFQRQTSLPARTDVLYELQAWVRVEGPGSLTLCASTWNKDNQALDWTYAPRQATPAQDWQLLRTRILVPADVVRIEPRLIGYGPITALVDDFKVQEIQHPGLSRRSDLPVTLVVSNASLEVSFRPDDATFSAHDLRCGREYRQTPSALSVIVTGAYATNREFHLKLYHPASGNDLSALLVLDSSEAEFTFELQGEGELPGPIEFPHPFASAEKDWLVIPMNEGISYPADDASVDLHRLIAYGGHGICMAFWGVTDGAAGHMAIIETPDDAAIRMQRVSGKLVVAPEWDPQQGTIGYARRLRYVFLESGGHVAMAKRYRAHAVATGLVRTLQEKRETNPNVDLLIGAVNVWCWDRDAVSIVRDMQAAGIDRILWSNQQSAENVRALNELSVLTSRYDIYQDVMDPAQFPNLQWVHRDWTTAAWPKDINLDRNGRWLRGWGVEAKDGSMIHCGVICDSRALPYAKERVPPELAASPYRARFIDTTTAAPWQECYHTNHPMTRSQSRQHKMELLRYFSEDLNLVTGCETGHDASVPFLHYFEGMLSLGPYRVPDAGRRMSVIWTNVPENVAKYQVGHAYRLPLWELVYHDCVVAQWYWGDYNNKLPGIWRKRDLFNLLYGTPPMFMFDRQLWQKEKARFVQSYKDICRFVREVGYSEMFDHRFLTDDRSVQQTRFASGHTITVNFGDTLFRLPGGSTVAPLGFHVQRQVLK